MKVKIFAQSSLLWPIAVAIALSSLMIFTQPKNLHADASQYDELAVSVLSGKFELNGEPTMYREPLYPVFKAAVYAIAGYHPWMVLWVQVVLNILSIVIVSRSVGVFDQRWKLTVAWLTAIYPGFAVLSASQLSETLAVFLIAVVGWLFVRLMKYETSSRKVFVVSGLLGAFSGLLILTKAAYQFFPFFLAVTIFFSKRNRHRIISVVFIMLTATVVVLPWIIRNGFVFGQYKITNRVGVVVYARALKARMPWEQLAVNVGSLFAGQATMIQTIPDTPPIIMQHWKEEHAEEALLESTGKNIHEIDSYFFNRGKQIIFSSPSVFARYVFWTVVDEGRLFALTSPLSPSFSIEGMFNVQASEHRMTLPRWVILFLAHLMQLFWWILICIGAWRLSRGRFWNHPSLLIVGYTALIYAPFDNIPRYSAPILPWIFALIAATFYNKRVIGFSADFVSMMKESPLDENIASGNTEQIMQVDSSKQT
jgi:4-amino-4-deoxy-L-arabinose transferase-like glycosyltransferase